MAKETTNIGPKEISRPGCRITYKAVFDFKKLYEFLHDWLLEEGYVVDGPPYYAPSNTKDMFETYYWERRTAQGFTDYIIQWRLRKNPDDQSSKWVDYKLAIDFLGLGITKTDVMHEGKKIGAYKGEINIELTPKIILDPSTIWKKDTFLGKFASVFVGRTYKKEIKYHKEIVDEMMFRFEEAIKNFFGLSTFGEHGEPFHPEKGLGWA